MPSLSKEDVFLTSTLDARLAVLERFRATASLVVVTVSLRQEKKKADMTEHPKAFDHVGLLVNGLPGTAGLPFI